MYNVQNSFRSMAHPTNSSVSNRSRPDVNNDVLENKTRKVTSIANIPASNMELNMSRQAKSAVGEVFEWKNKTGESQLNRMTGTSHSKVASTSSGRTMLSYDKVEVERRRLQAELILQEKMDEERIALKLEALKLKEDREKKYLNQMYQAMVDEDESGSEVGSRNSRNSKSSRALRRGNDIESVMAWIEGQRRQKFQLLKEIPNVSIDIEHHEIENIVDEQLRSQANMVVKDGHLKRKDDVPLNNGRQTVTQKEFRPMLGADSQNIRANSTFIFDRYPATSTFTKRQFNDGQTQMDHMTKFQPSTGTNPNLNHSREQIGRSVTMPIEQGQSSVPISRMQPIRPVGGWKHMQYQANNDRDQRVGGDQRSTVLQNDPQLVHQIEEPHNMNQGVIGSNNQTDLDSFRYISQRPPLTTNQIAARHVVSKKLPEFNGNPRDWPAFIQKFRRTTAAFGFDNTENLDRLAECLKEPARTIVESQLMIPDCVPSIIDTLEQKFGRKEIVVKAVLEEIRAEPPIRADRLETLSTFGYKVQNVCQNIQTQKMEFYLHDPGVIQELVDKLPYQLKIDWAIYSDGVSQVTLRTLSDWLIKLSRSLNRITMPKFTTNPSGTCLKKVNEKSKNSKDLKDSWIDKKSDGSKVAHVGVHGDENASTQAKGDNNCECCSKNCGQLVNCPKFKGMPVLDRWKFVYSHKKICRTCLCAHSKRCDVSKECGVNGCKYKHHTMLHDNDKLIKSKSNQPPGQSTQSASHNAHRGGRVLYKILPVVLSS